MLPGGRHMWHAQHPFLWCFFGEKAGDFLRAEWITIPELQNHPSSSPQAQWWHGLTWGTSPCRCCLHEHMVMQPAPSPESIRGGVFACAS